MLDTGKRLRRWPPANQVTFGAPGKYDFYCMIHPFMKATVTVQ